MTRHELRAVSLLRGGAPMAPCCRRPAHCGGRRRAQGRGRADFGASFDGVRPQAIRVPDAALDAVLAGLDCDVREAQVMVERTCRALGNAPTSQISTLGLARRSPSGGVHERVGPVRAGAMVPSSVVKVLRLPRASTRWW